MGKLHARIDDGLRAWIARQHVFFVATAPSSPDGHVNVSPKGRGALHVLGPRRVAYVDYVGSGVETIAHVRENGRITLMLCAFEGPPKILRLHGTARVIEPRDRAFARYRALLPTSGEAVRAVIVARIHRIADACGFGVPRMEHAGDRTQLVEWAARKGPGGVAEYQRAKNARSIDGLPGLRSP